MRHGFEKQRSGVYTSEGHYAAWKGVKERKNERMNWWMGEWVDEWMDEWVDEWDGMDGDDSCPLTRSKTRSQCRNTSPRCDAFARGAGRPYYTP